MQENLAIDFILYMTFKLQLFASLDYCNLMSNVID